MVGSIPCRLSSEIHVDGQRVATTPGHEMMGKEQEACPKWARVMSAHGQEIVGPGYTVRACSGEDGLENRSMQREEFPRASAPKFRGGVIDQRCDATWACIGGNRSNDKSTQYGESSWSVTNPSVS
jgi:hypothetical protein